jgi:hypothetical protein
MYLKFWPEAIKGSECLEYLGVDVRMVLKWILKK